MSVALAPGVTLPGDFAVKRAAIIARSGGGKTYTAAVLAEEMVDAGQPWYALDPTGAWWGLRAAADGRRAGLPVIVIGGEHGDVPLPPDGGAAIADLVVHEPSFYVLDLTELGSRGAEVRFATAFLERLYRAKAKRRNPLHGWWDEADQFAPQRSGPEEARMLGAAENVVRRGRIRGLGTTLITQRPAVVNKNVLSQIDVLVALRIGDPRDRRAVKDWLDGTPDPERAREVLASLAGLGLGEAWVYGPGETPPLYQRVRVRARRTFNSSAAGEANGGEPARLADVDLDALRERLAAVVERARADDPRALRARIRELERALAEHPAPEPERVEVPVVTPEALAEIDAMMRVADEAFERARDELGGLVREATEKAAEVVWAVESLRDQVDERQHVGPPLQEEVARILPRELERPVPRPVPQPMRRPAPSMNGSLAPARQRILDTLAWFEAVGIAAPRRAALAPMAGTKATSGGFKNNLGALRSGGLIDYPEPNRVVLTDDGRARAVEPAIAPTAEALQEAVLSALPPARARILDTLIRAYPRALAREDLAAAVDVPPTSGGFKNNLGALRTQELIDYPQPGTVVALPILFLEAGS